MRVRSLLVLTKYRFMGDTVVASPLLRAARRAFPDARITLLTGPAAVTVLAGCPYVDRFVSYDPYNTQRGALALLGLTRALRREGRPDLCLVADRSFRSALFALLCGGRVRAGFASEGRSRLLTHPVPYHGEKHETECYLDILRAVAPEPEGEPYDPTPQLWVTDGEREDARQMLAERGVAPGTPLVGMQPAAHDALVREWGAERFACVADRLARERGMRAVLLGSADERPVSERVAAAMTHAPLILTGETGLRQALAAISHCRLWIGNDGGLLHMAVALGLPTVGIFGPTKAVRWGYPPPHRTMVVYPDTPATDPQTIRRCLDAITPDAVFEAALAALQTAAPV